MDWVGFGGVGIGSWWLYVLRKRAALSWRSCAVITYQAICEEAEDVSFRACFEMCHGMERMLRTTQVELLVLRTQPNAL